MRGEGGRISPHPRPLSRNRERGVIFGKPLSGEWRVLNPEN